VLGWCLENKKGQSTGLSFLSFAVMVGETGTGQLLEFIQVNSVLVAKSSKAALRVYLEELPGPSRGAFLFSYLVPIGMTCLEVAEQRLKTLLIEAAK
jgi:hypothetical protein